MANEKLRITIEAEGGSADATLRELTEQIEDLKREAAETADELEGMDDAAEGMGDSAGKTSKGFGGMKLSLADVKAGLDMAGQAMGVLKQGLEMTVGAAANWGDEMGDLAAMTGQSVEEVSTMAATFELVGIKGDTLNKILKTLAQDGINLNMRELRELSAQYQKLQDPVQKNKFLFDHFGKSAGDMAEIMGRTTEELDRLTLAAQASGKVIGEDAAEAAEKLNIQMAKLQQRAEGFGIAVGNFVIPSVVGLFEGFDQLTAAAQSGEVSWLEYANRLAAVATGHGTAATLTAGLTDKTAELLEEVEPLGEATLQAAETFDIFGLAAYGAATASFSLAVKEQEATRAARELMQAEGDLADAIAGPIGKENERYIQQQADIRLKMQDVQGEIDKLNAKKYLTPEQQTELGGLKTTLEDLQKETEKSATAHEEATARIVFGFVQQRMAADGLQDGEITALANIGRAWGIYDEDTARALDAVDKSISEHGANAAAIIKDVGDAINGLPDTKEIVIQVRTNGAQIGDENFGGWTAPAGSGKPKAGADTQINGMRAAGGPVMGGGAYVVGEQGPELFVPRQSGTVIPNGAAGPTYNLNVTTMQSMGRIQDDFALMRAMAGV